MMMDQRYSQILLDFWRHNASIVKLGCHIHQLIRRDLSPSIACIARRVESEKYTLQIVVDYKFCPLNSSHFLYGRSKVPQPLLIMVAWDADRILTHADKRRLKVLVIE